MTDTRFDDDEEMKPTVAKPSRHHEYDTDPRYQGGEAYGGGLSDAERNA